MNLQLFLDNRFFTTTGSRSVRLSHARHLVLWRSRCLRSWSRAGLNLYKARIKRSSAADVSKGFCGQHVDAVAVWGKTRSIQPRCHNSRLYRAIHVGTKPDLTATVKDSHPIAFMDVPALGVRSADLQQFRLLHLLYGGNVGKRAVAKVVRFARQQFQREFLGPP